MENSKIILNSSSLPSGMEPLSSLLYPLSKTEEDGVQSLPSKATLSLLTFNLSNGKKVALEAKSCPKIILPPFLFHFFLAETLQACQDNKRNEGHICKKKHLHKALKTNFVVFLFSLDTIMEMTLPKRSANVSKSNDTFV